MKWYAIVAGNAILAIGCGHSCEPETEITENEYNNIRNIILNKPADPDGFSYKLRASDMEWELVEIPDPEPVEENAEIADYENALTEMGVDFSD